MENGQTTKQLFIWFTYNHPLLGFNWAPSIIWAYALIGTHTSTNLCINWDTHHLGHISIEITTHQFLPKHQCLNVYLQIDE